MSSNVFPAHSPDCLFIAGRWMRPLDGGRMVVIDSGTEEPFAEIAQAGISDVDKAVQAARQAFDEGPWPRMSHSERARYLRAIAEECRQRAAEIASTWTVESGVLHAVTQATAPAVGMIYDWHADMAETFPFVERRTPLAGNVGLLVREPVGVVAAIVPWNGPAVTAAFKCAPALLAGCTVVLKASPEAPGTMYVLAEICEKVGLPAGVLNLITADRAVSEALVSHAGVDKVSFTGSTAAGRRVASICGERIARFTLELGGKSPALVLDDFDVGTAAKVLATQAIAATGQVCSSLTRIIVSRRRHDELVEALSDVLGKVQVGDPFDPASSMGPLATARQRERVEGYVASGVSEGAKLAVGGRRPPDIKRGFFFEPTVFGEVHSDQRIAREEIFGPVLAVMPADSDEHAVAIANDTIFGLNASVFTRDAERAYSIARRLRCGTVGHNEFRSDFGIAVGGFKQSGIGREGGTEGLLQYLETKTVILDDMPEAI